MTHLLLIPGKSDAEVLARELYPMALNFLERRGVDDPGEVASRVFMAALESYRPSRASFKTYLFLVLRWRAADWYRRNVRRKAMFAEMPEDFDAAAESLPPFDDRDALEKSLSEGWRLLNLIEQRLLWLHHVCDYTYEEMAAQKSFIGCPLWLPAMRARVSRALKVLRPFLMPFKGVTEDELIESMHRVAKAAGTLDVNKTAPAGSTRRRRAAVSRCARRKTKR